MPVKQMNVTKQVTGMGPVKTRSGQWNTKRTFFVEFSDGEKAMFDEKWEGSFENGDQIRFDGFQSNPDWYSVTPTCRVKVLQKAEREDIPVQQFHLGYVSNPKTSTRGEEYLIAIAIPEEAFEVEEPVTSDPAFRVYIPMNVMYDYFQAEDVVKPYSTIEVTGTSGNDIYFVNKILSHEQHFRTRRFLVYCHELIYHDGWCYYEHTPINGDVTYKGRLLPEHLNFIPSASLEAVKDTIKGQVEIEAKYETRVKVKPITDGTDNIVGWEDSIEFIQTAILNSDSTVQPEQLQKLHGDLQAMIRWQRFIIYVRGMMQHNPFVEVEMITELAEKMDVELTPDRWSTLVLKPAYEVSFYEKLKAHFEFIGHTSDYLVFKAGKHLIIETPMWGRATYILKDPETQKLRRELISQFDACSKTQLIRNKDGLADILGMTSRVIHNEAWWFNMKLAVGVQSVNAN